MLTIQTMTFMEAVEEASSRIELETTFEHFLKELSVTQYCMGEVRGILPEDGLDTGNWSQEWLDRYFDNNYLYLDPVIENAIASPAAFSWEQLERVGSLEPAQRKILNEAREFGIKSGFTVPIFEGNGYLAVASFGCIEDEVPKKVYLALQLATLYFHAKLMTFRVPSRQRDVFLSKRERECLHWAAAGKSDWEIGEILTIAQSTVHTHIEKAKRRYGVPTRVQAVVRALGNRELCL